MKHYHILIGFLLFSFIGVFGQNDVEKEKWRYFEGFSDSKKKIIIDNWNQYFKADILKNLDSTMEYFPIMFDSYGSPYPNLNLFNGADDEFFSGGIEHDADTRKYSMYQIFKKNEEKINKNIKKIGNPERKYYSSLLAKSQGSIEEFYEAYDTLHFAKLEAELKLKLEKKKKILFFIHGYNVPYGLANVQSIALMHILKDSLKINMEEVLFVPVFWSSNDAKEHQISNRETFSTKNHEDYENGKKMWYYSNRAYYAALGLRKIINGIDPNCEVLIFSHSLGATIATTALINTTSKFDYNPRPVIGSVSCNEHKISNPEAIIKNELTYDLVSIMAKESLPVHNVKVFLGAAAIPGENTFGDIEECVMQNKKFYVTINLNDIMRTKNVVRSRYLIPEFLVNANNYSSTSLGCNYENDAVLTQINYPIKGNFEISGVSLFEDHEIFAYMNQQLYRNFIRRWFYGQ